MTTGPWSSERIRPRIRVISDNDYAGDPDGLVQLAHELLSPSTETVAVIATHLRAGDGWVKSDDTVGEGVNAAQKIVELCGLSGQIPVLRGALPPLADRKNPQDSEGVRAIIREAMREDTDVPLFVVCGASLTEIASAWLIEPRIAERLTLVWIGGHEHESLAEAPVGGTDMEYNLHIDPIAGQVVFNDSNLNVWQFARDSYRQVLASRAELFTRLRPQGPLGLHLYNSLGEVADMVSGFGLDLGEIYILGDSPLVLATALQSSFQPDLSSSQWVTKPCPKILDTGLYEENPDGRPMRVFTRVDTRVLLEDLYAKLEMLHRGQIGE
jgi:inosine-uridine nucleoside N-ribohydrolase